MPTTTATAQDIVARSLKFAGILGAGEAPSAEDASDALDIVNGMLDAWTMDRLFVYVMVPQKYALTSNVQTYAIGSGATPPFNTTRPDFIHHANIVITSQTPNVRRPLYVTMDPVEWMSISIETPTVTGIPTVLYYQRDYTSQRGTLKFWVVPQGGLSVEIEQQTQLAQFVDLTTAFSFPPGYYEAIYQNLGLRLCTPEWGITDPPSSIATLAMESRRRIESLNMDPPPRLITDAGLQGTRQGDYRQGEQRFNIKNPAPQWYR